MKVEIKNSNIQPSTIKSLYDYFLSSTDTATWEYNGLTVELDPTIDFKNNDALIRWTDTNEGFNDKLIVGSLNEFLTHFQLIK